MKDIAQFVHLWEANKRTFKTPVWFMRFLQIAVAGETGAQWSKITGGSERGQKLTAAWARKGLVEACLVNPPKGRPMLFYKLGPQGKQLLGITETEESKDTL